MSPSLRQFIAEEQRAIGLYAEALQSARACVEEARSNTHARYRTEVIRDCSRLVAELERRVAPPPPLVTAPFAGTARYDRDEPPTSAATPRTAPSATSTAVRVDPGRVHVEETAPGRQSFVRDIPEPAGSEVRVRVEAAPAVVTTATPRSTDGATTPETPGASSRLPNAGQWTLAGAGVAMLGGALATFLVDENIRAGLDARCARVSNGVTGELTRECNDPNDVAEGETHDALFWVNNVLFFGGLTAVTGATVWYFIARLRAPERSPTTWNFQFTPSPAGFVWGVRGTL